MLKTYATKISDIEHKWYVVDAAGQPLGRLASRVATILKGKHKPMYSTNIDTGDFVVVVNAERVYLSGNKPIQKVYKHHSMHPGGLKVESIATVLANHPTRVVERAVKGMLPKNTLGDHQLKKLKVYAGPEHPHQAQKVEPLPPPVRDKPGETERH
jgi:large subunit ribosomal protein L13